MGAAGAAHLDQTTPQRCPRTVEAHRRVVGRQPFLRSDLRDRALSELDLADDVGVFGLQRRNDSTQAGTDVLAQLRLERGLGVALQLGVGFPFDSGPPEVIHDGVAKDPVEPGDHALLVPDVVELFEAPCVRFLQDIFGDGVALDAAPEELEESAVMLGKDVIGRAGRGCVHVVGACHTMRGSALLRNRELATVVGES